MAQAQVQAPQGPAPIQAIAMPAQVLADQFTRLENEIRAEGISRDSKTYNGEGTKKLKEWVKEMDKYERIINGDQARMRTFAIMTLTGLAGDYLRRVLTAHPQATWNDIKDAIIARFSDLADQHYALRKLKQVKQGTGESVQAYGERVLNLAEDAHPGQPANQPVLQRELIDVFIEGLTDDGVVRRLLRNRPADIFAAIDSAMEEQQVSRVFKAQRRYEEPMDVDEINIGSKRLEILEEKFDVLTSSMLQLTELQKQQYAQDTRPYQGQGQANRGYSSGSRNQGSSSHPGNKGPYQYQQHNSDQGSRSNTKYDKPFRKHEYTSDGKPICNYCKAVSHIYRDCRKRQFDEKQRQTNASGNRVSGNQTHSR